MDDMTIKVTAGGPDIEADVYPGEFIGAEIWDPKDAAGNPTSQYGPSRRWRFNAIDDGELIEVDRLTGLSVSPGSIGGKILTAIIGRQPEVDETIDLRGYVNAKVQLVIGPNKKGWMHVESVLPAKKAK